MTDSIDGNQVPRCRNGTFENLLSQPVALRFAVRSDSVDSAVRISTS